MLLSDGPSDAVVQGLSEELDWTKKQTEDFTALVHGEGDRGLGTQWVDWLNRLVSDEQMQKGVVMFAGHGLESVCASPVGGNRQKGLGDSVQVF
jgi:hypothetical protein